MNDNKHYDNITITADGYGLKHQIGKAVEEIGELLAELGRVMCGADNLGAVIEETADTYNMLDQLCYLFEIENEVQEIAEKKMQRTAAKFR